MEHKNSKDAGEFIVVDALSNLLADVLRKRRAGRKGVIEKDWVPAMRNGGIDMRVATINHPLGYPPELSLRNGLDSAAALHQEVDESPSITMITKFEDIAKAKKDGKIGFILGIQGAEPLSNDIELLRIFYILGLRVLTLAHLLRNYVGDGVSLFAQEERKLGGITDFGVKVIEEANDLGIVIDVSHLNEPGFWDVMELTKATVVASHSNCRALSNFPRNLTDDQIKAVINNGGVIGINSACDFFVDKENPDLEHVLNHIEHIVSLGGIRNVGLGFDFLDYLLEGETEEQVARHPKYVPIEGLSRDEEVPNVTKGLLKRGYSDEDIELILGKNFLRVFRKVWK